MGMTMGMVFLLWSMNVFIKAVGLANSSCRGVAVCGIVTIPYPFGIEPGCYIEDWIAIDCKNTLGSPKPFLRRLDLEVLDLSLEGTLHVKLILYHGGVLLVIAQQFSLVIGGCISVCEEDTIKTNGSSCNGVDCSQTTIPSDLDAFTIRIQSMNEPSPFERTKDCKYLLSRSEWFEENLTNHFEVRKMSHVPVVLNWEINANLSFLVMGIDSSHSTCQFANRSSSLGNMSSTFSCSCDSGFEGNPYLVDGCQAMVACRSGGLLGLWLRVVVVELENPRKKESVVSELACGRVRKYTTTLPFFGRDINGPAHPCRSSKHTEDEDEAEADADADAPTTKFELDPPLLFNSTTENNDEDVEDEPDNVVSSSSVVFRSIR
uniref:Wall-associated receptor kinase galacturonan-binding domain-containing protein n=1 Tax=Quercus lobata TaxID=97700 RepID=A0A7N2RDW0_QUELO